jgi:hypothetical protein
VRQITIKKDSVFDLSGIFEPSLVWEMGSGGGRNLPGTIEK